MDEELDCWEEAIDIDDSDLPSLLPSFPPLLPCSQLSRPSLNPAPDHSPSSRPSPVRSNSPNPLSRPKPRDSPPRSTTTASSFPRVIPGPAGAVQAAMHRMSAAAAAMETDPCLEGVERPDERLDLDEDDVDFKMNPWLCALGFLGEDCGLVSPISSIKTRSIERAPLVMGLVKCCTPNGLGDLFLTLKDPTGIIDASMHRRVLLEGNLGSNISVGCVLILHKVVVFSPVRSVCYLNVTLDNVVKIVSKDCGPSHKQVILSDTVRFHLPDKYMEIRPKAAFERDTRLTSRAETRNLAHGEMSTILTGGRVIVGKEGIGGSFSCSSGATAATTTIGANTNHCLGKNQKGEVAKDPSGRFKSINPDEDLGENFNFLEKQQEIGMDEVRGDPSAKHVSNNSPNEDTSRSLSCKTLVGSGKTSLGGKLSCTADATTAAVSMSSKPEHENNDSRKLISKVSVAQWTDEQLSELFADYPD